MRAFGIVAGLAVFVTVLGGACTSDSDGDPPVGDGGPDTGTSSSSSSSSGQNGSSSGLVDAGRDSASEAGSTCDAPEVACGSVCADLQTNPAHCGGCNQPCGASERCMQAECTEFCTIAGVVVRAGDHDPENDCAQCDPGTSTTDWSPRAEQSSCGTGQFCVGEACVARCLIDGELYEEGAINPQNRCQSCAPATANAAWSQASEVVLLVGGTDVAAQGWNVISQSPATLSYEPGVTRLATTTTAGARAGGQLLLDYPTAVEAGQPYKIRVELKVDSVGAPPITGHNALDASVAILGSFTPTVGNSTDRAQMVYLDTAVVGWADDTQSAVASPLDGFHFYELAIDAANVATLSIDGVAKLTRNNFVTDRGIAIGDQTNDSNVDSVIQLRSVVRICTP